MPRPHLRHAACLAASASAQEAPAAPAAPSIADQQPAALDAGFQFVRMTTDKGEMHLLLDGVGAPLTTANFLGYVAAGFYDGTIFHRIIKDFVIQGGGFTAEGIQKQTREGVRNEWQNGLRNDDYSLSMARLGGQPHSGTSQFFVNTKDNPALDTPRDNAAYAVFGIVVDGRPVGDAIEAVTTGPGTLEGRTADVPTEPVRILSATRMKAEDLSETGRANALAWQTRYAEARATMADRAERLERARTLLAAAKPTESGLKSAIVTPGEPDADMPPVPSTIVASYTGWLAEDGWCFDTSLGKPQGDTFQARLQPRGLIQGWVEGIPMMRVGETRVFEIPASLAYGDRGYPPVIPGRATLIFEVTLRSFTADPAPATAPGSGG
ncbi:MAG: peptidylprolyl isomerase [Planctomycetota bacterium]|jgi:cyclophilin family peptidyl-prolyl cis-trans isomerase